MHKAQGLELDEEFINDPMMQELHQMREEMEKELEGLSPEEKVRRINEEATRFWKELGYDLAPTGQGTYRIRKVKKRSNR